ALAADTPTPGGGSAAALMVATGAALVEMVCGLTLGNEKFRDVEPLMAQSREKARGLRANADALRLDDSLAYDAVMAAYRLPKSTAEEKEARTAAVQEALRGATEVPLRSVVAGVEVLDLAASIVESVNPNAISDVGAGALAARAGAEASALNVRINLLSIKDPTYASMQKAALDALLARAVTTTEHVVSAVRLAMGG
ncbi:MAG TPA: cyclodeaminase/cyclohydrolase family protein, partial [Chloroflexota bacterium]|nr:cyclodeaminase/cyclohydrolase family protein [Chloroflexota bacterium]